MKTFIKIISFVLIFAFAILLLPSCGDSEKVPIGGDGKFSLPIRNLVDNTEYTEGFYKYKVFDDNTAAIIQYSGSESDIVIPEKLGGYNVSTIGSGAFYRNESVVSVTIPSTVETIGSSAFNGCMLLTNVNISKNAWEIYPDVFTDTPYLAALSNEEFVIVGDSVLLKYNGTDSKVVIPDTVKHLSAAFIGNETIKDVTIPDSVYTVGCAAFSTSTVSRVELGNNVVYIGDSAFGYCSNLYYINMPESLKRIDTYAFVSCTGLNYVRIGKNVEYIGKYAFYRASQIEYVYLPKSLLQKNEDGTYKKTIEDFSFEDCGNLRYVFFEGTEEEFGFLDVKGYNSYLNDARKKYNYNY